MPEDMEAPKHTYTVEITRAMFHQETFELFCKYQQEVHNDEKGENDKDGFESFLC